MEQTATETTQSAPELMNVEATRKEMEALRRDIETLRADLRTLYQSAKGAGKVTLDDAKSRLQATAKNLETWATTAFGTAQDQSRKFIEMSREQIRQRPFATVAGAVLVGMMFARLRAKH